jgi:spermidine synthase
MRDLEMFPSMIEKIPEGHHGSVHIEHFTITKAQSSFCALRALINRRPGEYISAGSFARLVIDSKIMMTDTDMERATNYTLFENAVGHVLVGGLGLGMVVFALLAKKPAIRSLTILEKNTDVIALVQPHLPRDPRLTIVLADVFTWEKKKCSPRFNTIYMDIWPSICGYYREEVENLRKRFRPWLSPKGWMSDWQTEYTRYSEYGKAFMHKHGYAPRV